MPAVIRLEEHAQDALYAIAHGIPWSHVETEWAEVDAKGRRRSAKPYGWWWSALNSGTPNQRFLIRCAALVDWRLNAGMPWADQPAEPVVNNALAAVTRDLDDWLARGIPEWGTTYLRYYLLGLFELARVFPHLGWPLSPRIRHLLASSAAIVDLLDGRLVGDRSKRERDPQVVGACQLVHHGRPLPGPPMAVRFQPGSTETNRGLYLTAAADAACRDGALDGIAPVPLGEVRLRVPFVLVRWPGGEWAAYAAFPLASYDNAQAAVVFRDGRYDCARHPEHGFAPDAPIRVERLFNPSRLVVHWSGYAYRTRPGKPPAPRADLVQEIALPAGAPVSREVIG